jgi:phosphatidylserine/phosphatidylglycerophosphate/cardiolipin synthase-like enzyme
MRFQSPITTAGQVFAVSGVNTISFAIIASDHTKQGLLGFAVERVDPTEHEQYYMPGFKVFPSVYPNPAQGLFVSTYEQPVQSFVWDDFTAKPGRRYEYRFHPLKGSPKNLERSTAPLRVEVETEALYTSGDGAHDVFFNRGVASSQAYERRFHNRAIDTLSASERSAALAWLSRDLDDALLKFIKACQSGDRLLGCFYEFDYEPVARELVAAVQRGVDVRLVVDAKDNAYTDRKGKHHPSFPLEENDAMLQRVGFPDAKVVRRRARESYLQHNKFMVRVVGSQPTEVWTGSTNISLNAIAGQTNVGHWVRDKAIADDYRSYWDLLATDPGAQPGAGTADVRTENANFRKATELITKVPDDPHDFPAGTSAIFSPRTGLRVLEDYATLLDGARGMACITLAFSVASQFKSLLQDNTKQSALVFMLLEKRDKPSPKNPSAFVKINASNNVYQAWGSYLQGPVYQWARETNARKMRLAHHVSYIHSKFMLVDPLGADPIVVTGSANFSEASTNENDENMLVIRGNKRVADIYFTEFNRLFNHYYFRSVTEDRASRGDNDTASLFLREDDTWQAKYAPGSFKARRLAAYQNLSP